MASIKTAPEEALLLFGSREVSSALVAECSKVLRRGQGTSRHTCKHATVSNFNTI